MGRTGSILWLFVASIVQILWGFYPAILRFAQTRMPHHLSSLQLAFLINVCAVPALMMQTLMQALYGAGYARGMAAAASSADAAMYAYEITAATPRRPLSPLTGRRIKFRLPQNVDAVLSPRVSESPRLAMLAQQEAQAERERLNRSPNRRYGGSVYSGPAFGSFGVPDDDALAPLPLRRKPKLGGAGGSAGGGIAGGAAASEPGSPRPAGFCKKLALLLGTTTALTTLMLSQIFALMFVEAYISQMVFLLAPLLVSTLALIVLRTPLPPLFWPTLFLMLLGSALVVGGKAEAADKGGDGLGLALNVTLAGYGAAPEPHALPRSAGLAAEPLQLLATVGYVGVPGLPSFNTTSINWNDVAGVGLSLLSALSLATFMLTVQAAAGAISEAEVLWANFPTQAALSFGLTWTLEQAKFQVLDDLLFWEWLVVIGVSVAVNWLANLLQQVTIKELGAPQVAAFLPLRLVGSMIASYFILGEVLDNVLEAVGAGLVLLTLTWYLIVQKRYADAAAEDALCEEADLLEHLQENRVLEP